MRIAVVYRGRALPVAWRVLHHPSASVSFETYQEMLHQAAACLPAGVKVILLADRGFVHGELMRACVRRWHWHCRVRLKTDTWLWRAGQGWCQLKDFHFARGEALCFHNVRLHKQQRYSYFRIGWDWLKAALENGWPLIHHVCFTHNCDPEPAMASRKQHERRTYRIEFKIHTYCYLAD